MSNEERIHSRIVQQISKGRTIEAINTLQQLGNETGDQTLIQASCLLAARYESYRKASVVGLLSSEAAEGHLREIQKSVLELSKHGTESMSLAASEVRKGKIALLLGLSILFFLVLSLWQSGVLSWKSPRSGSQVPARPSVQMNSFGPNSPVFYAPESAIEQNYSSDSVPAGK